MLHQQAQEEREQELGLCLTVCFVVEDVKKSKPEDLNCREILITCQFAFRI